MKNFIELNIKQSTTSLKEVDHTFHLSKNDKLNIIVPVRKCNICGVPQIIHGNKNDIIIKFYDGLCQNCIKHYINDY